MKRKFRNIILIIIIISMIIPTIVLGFDTSPYTQVTNETKVEKIDTFLSDLLGVVQVVSGFALLISLMILGIQLMHNAPTGKAEAKKRIMGIAIGAFLVFCASTIIKAVGDVANQL